MKTKIISLGGTTIDKLQFIEEKDGFNYYYVLRPEQLAEAQALGYSTAGAFTCMCAEAALGVGENTVQVVIRLNGDDNQIYVLREYTVILEA